MAILIPILLLLSPLLLFSLQTLISISVTISRRRKTLNPNSVGFFHPYANDGGGGERVLWCAVRAVQDHGGPGLRCTVYTGDDVTSEGLLRRALERFGVELLRPVEVIHLTRRKWIEEKTYPRFTMIGQSLGSIYLSWEALCKYTPQFYFDTSGYAFTYPLAKLFGCKVICYTHYPTISSDMVSRVLNRSDMYNNDQLIAKSVWLSRCKVVYYFVFSFLYGLVGSYANIAIVNSSWTKSHIVKLWKIPERTKLVYPPCDTSALQMLPLERSTEPPIIISVAQFRPEKAHMLQLEAFKLALDKLGPQLIHRPKLQIVGSCRNKEDENRFQKLKEKCVELNLEDSVEFHKDVTYKDLVRLLGGAIVGLHSMVDEHFGISVVEYMAAGAIPLANNSAGPKMDIILQENGQQTGFLASSKEEYADAIVNILTMSESERLSIACAARNRAKRFSEESFYREFKDAIKPVFDRVDM